MELKTIFIDSEERIFLDGEGMLVEYFTDLERRGAIQNFDSDNVTVEAGAAINAVLVNCGIQLVGSMELAYINVNLT